MKALGRDKKKNEDVKRMSSVVEGSVSTLEQYTGTPGRRVRTKPDRAKMERGWRIMMTTTGDNKQEAKRQDTNRRSAVGQPKRKVVSPREGHKVTAVAKRPWKGEPSYADMCAQPKASEYSER